CVEFNAGENEDQYQKAVESYKRSLDYYKKALRAYPSCPGAARLGIGYCRYILGQFDKARQAFHRVLDLDPKNVDALVALGIMELQTNEVDGIQKGMLKMQRAFEIYPYCSVGDFEKAGWYYMASIKEINKPQEFALPFYVCKKAHVQQFVATEDALNKVNEDFKRKLEEDVCGCEREASDFWDHQPAAAQEHATRTIIPACNSVANVSSSSKDLIEKELSTFNQILDNRLYMMPSTPQALLESMGSAVPTSPDAHAATEKSAF
ncbi:hypothetical protein HPP92_026930, partial [Vanilla planifolia]